MQVSFVSSFTYCQKWPSKISTNNTEYPVVKLKSHLWKRSHELWSRSCFVFLTYDAMICAFLDDNINNKWFVPAEWLFSSWYHLTINLVTQLSLGNITGNLALYGKNSLYFSRPLHLINPSLSNSGEILASLLLVETWPPVWRVSYSCLKYFFCDGFIEQTSASTISAGPGCLTSHCFFTDLLFWMNLLTQSITLNSLFQFENLLKSSLHFWCGTVWHITETTHILKVFLNSKLLFSASSNLLLWPISFLAKREFWSIPPFTTAR